MFQYIPCGSRDSVNSLWEEWMVISVCISTGFGFPRVVLDEESSNAPSGSLADRVVRTGPSG